MHISAPVFETGVSAIPPLGHGVASKIRTWTCEVTAQRATVNTKAT